MGFVNELRSFDASVSILLSSMTVFMLSIHSVHGEVVGNACDNCVVTAKTGPLRV